MIYGTLFGQGIWQELHSLCRSGLIKCLYDFDGFSYICKRRYNDDNICYNLKTVPGIL